MNKNCKPPASQTETGGPSFVKFFAALALGGKFVYDRRRKRKYWTKGVVEP